jgi:predicted transcriptional regulator
MATLGELERAIMDLLWQDDTALSAYDLQEALADRKLAPTTILTVLSRLEAKGFVTRDRRSRPHLYSAAASREDHMAELMHEVLGGASDRTAVLERFVGQVSRDEAETLRRLLGG